VWITIMKAPRLDSIPLFARLPEDSRAQLARSARRVRCVPGEEIVQERAFSFEFFAIEDGTADVVREGEHVAELGPGDFFGEMGVLPQGGLTWSRRNSAVVARSPLTLIAIPGHDFRQAVEDISELRDAILATVAARRRQAERESV
jgi:CRP-like cAMP-binding protein